MQIEVKELHDSPSPSRSATVVAVDGKKYDAWPQVYSVLQVGRRYEIAVKETHKNGRTYTSILKATPISPAPVVALPPPESGATAAPSSGEAEYVGRVLSALILKGEIQPKEIGTYTLKLRRAWAATDPAQHDIRGEQTFKVAAE